MGKEKGGFLSPKAISNRIKSKGLQKLRWYCQMCQKQCRDENGFKCHLTSESHQRQLLLFAENPDKYIDTFSQEFLDGYSELLKRRFGTRRVHANQVYQEYISDREHVHMNSTQWETLTDFIKWLGKEGKAVVDETEKGWFVQYIDRDPEAIRRQESVQKKEKMDLDDEEKMARFIEKQIEKAGHTSKETREAEATVLQRESEEEKVIISMGAKKSETPATSRLAPVANPFKSSAAASAAAAPGSSKVFAPPKTLSAVGTKRKSALDEIMKFEEQKKEKKNRKDYWLCTDITVKVCTKKLGDVYYKKKGVVKEVKDNYVAVLKMLDTGYKIKVDQEHLSTVIPAIGRHVMIVNGAHRGHMATLLGTDEEHYCCTVKIASGPSKGLVVDSVQYEDLSKLHMEA